MFCILRGGRVKILLSTSQPCSLDFFLQPKASEKKRSLAGFKKDGKSSILLGHTVACRKTGLFGKLLCKWGHFERAKTTLKIMLASWFLVCFFKKFRCFNAENLGSVGQWAAKLPAIKLSEWLDRDRESNPSRLADWGRLAYFFLRPPTLTASNFAALWPTDSKFLAFKHLNLLKKHTKNQENNSILRVGFALSKWPHLHREWPKNEFFCKALYFHLIS